MTALSAILRWLMLKDPRNRQILALALPIIGGMASQNVLNLVDTAMVGVLGPTALAAVGMASFANFMASAFITGLATGVQAVAARRMGEGRQEVMARPLNGGLTLAIGLAVPLSLVLFVLADLFFPLLVDDPEVVRLGVPYLQARLVAMTALGCNFAFRGYWNGIGRSTVYLRTIVVMHACNIVLNWLLIFGNLGFPRLGSTGAGVASAIAMFIGTGLYLAQGLSMSREAGFLAGLPDRATLIAMLRLSVPAGLQHFFFATGMTVFFWIVGRIGTPELAASNVLVNLLLVVLLPGLGFGLASATLVGQSLGRGCLEEAAAWPWRVSRIAATVVALIGAVGVAAPDLVLSAFLHDPQTLDLARLPLRLLGATMAFDTVGTVLMHSLFGAGHNRPVMMVATGLQWGLFLPAAWLVGPVLGGGLSAVWIAQVAYRAVQTVAFVLLWRRRGWARVEV